MKDERIDHPCVPVYGIGETVYILNETANGNLSMKEVTVDSIDIKITHNSISTIYTVIGTYGNAWIKPEPKVFESVENLREVYHQIINEIQVNI